MDGRDQYFKKKKIHPKFHIAPCVKFWLIYEKWCYNGTYKLIALKLHNSCSYIVIIELHKLHPL
jgi:hypothetical protein